MGRRLFFPSENPHCLARSVSFPFRIYSLAFFFSLLLILLPTNKICAEKSHFLHSDLKWQILFETSLKTKPHCHRVSNKTHDIFNQA